MSRSESSPPSPERRPLNIRIIIGALAVLAGLLIIVLANLPSDSPAPAPKPEAKDGQKLKAKAELASFIEACLEDARQALKKGELLETVEHQQMAETVARYTYQAWPKDQEAQALLRQAEEIVFQLEASAGPYPDEAALPGAGEINDLFLAGWAGEKRNQPEAASGIYNQALDRLDALLKPEGDPEPAPAVEPRHSEVPIPPLSADLTAESRYLQKYYAVASRLADLEAESGHEDRAEAARRRALAAMDQGLARGTEAADFSLELDSLLASLARRERLTGRLESARLTLQRRLGLKQYLLARAGRAPTAADPPALPPEALPGSARPATPPAAAADPYSAKIRLELAWLARHTFHFDEGLDYLAELPGLAASTVTSETDRQAWLTQGEMLMDLGRFQEAELALQKARPYLSRLLDAPEPALVGRVDVEPRVTAIRSNLALAELGLAQADLSGADRYMEEAVYLYNTLPGGHPVTFDVQLLRVKVLARKGDSQRAERELTGFLADSSQLLASPEVDIWVKRQILALMAEAAWQAQARGETDLAIAHYKRVNDELTPYITGIDVPKSSEYGSLFRPILVEIMEGEGDLWAGLRRPSQAESRYVLGLDMARALRDQEPRQYFWRTRFDSLAGKVEQFHY